MKIDTDEKELLESVERGEWKSAGGGKRERVRFSRYAKATFKKDRRLNIRLSSTRCATLIAVKYFAWDDAKGGSRHRVRGRRLPH